MTETEAVNLMLRAIGSSPVNSIAAGTPDIANARATLKRLSRAAQKRGWWFNIVYNQTYQPDPVTKEIVVGREVVSLQATNACYVKRGTKLFDSLNNTTQFEEDVVIWRLTRILSWNDLPESMQEYVAYQSAAEFIRDELEDLSKKNDYMKEAGRSYIELKQEDLESGQYNMFDARKVAQARGGVQPYHTGKHRQFGAPDR